MTVRSDAERYGDVFLFVDRSIDLHRKLGIKEPWNEWEYPRRIAVLDMETRIEDAPVQEKLL